jgi:hypothetical protein
MRPSAARAAVAALALLLALLVTGTALVALEAPSALTDQVKPGPPPPYVLHTLPGWVSFGGVALGRHVFLKASQQTAHGLGHELVHVRQQAADPLWFWVSYLALPRWRLRWEAEAYAVHARARCPIDGDRGLAAYLSGPAYLWVSSRAQAAAEIRRFL